jgi:hypothetical protein
MRTAVDTAGSMVVSQDGGVLLTETVRAVALDNERFDDGTGPRG